MYVTDGVPRLVPGPSQNTYKARRERLAVLQVASDPAKYELLQRRCEYANFSPHVPSRLSAVLWGR